MLDGTFKISGKAQDDVVIALEEILRLVKEGFTSAPYQKNERGSFSFDISGEEEEEEQNTEE